MTLNGPEGGIQNLFEKRTLEIYNNTLICYSESETTSFAEI